MYPTNLLALALADALAGDVNSLGAVLALKVHPVLAPLVPSGTVDFTALNPATFTGSAALAVGAAPQLVGVDPATGDVLITLKEPAGGWRWECTVAPASPETVVGVVVTDNGDTDTWGSQLLAAPVTISAVGHEVSVGSIVLRLRNPFAT